MKIKEILNTTIDIFGCSKNSGRVWYEQKLLYFLNDLSIKNKNKIETLRQLNKEDEKQAKKYKKENIIACTISATFDTYRLTHKVKNLNGLIAIDIDKDKNTGLDVNKAKQDVMKFPFVALSMLSCRGEGIWCLIPYNKDNDFNETFVALREDFKNLGYVIDGCKDVTRLRFLSYDPNILINSGEIEVYNKTVHIERIPVTSTYSGQEWKLTKDDYKDLTVAVYLLVNYLDYTADEYDEWLLEGFRLATMPNKEIGLKLFTMISEKSDNFESYEDVENKFEECCNTTTYTTNILGYYINRVREQLGTDWRYRANDLLKGKIVK